MKSAMGKSGQEMLLEEMTHKLSLKGCQSPAKMRRTGRMFKEEGPMCAESCGCGTS